MISGVFYRLAPRARYSEIIPIIRTAIFKRDNMFYDPIVFWSKLAPAFPAASMTLDKKLDDFSFCKPDTGIVMPGGARHEFTM